MNANGVNERKEGKKRRARHQLFYCNSLGAIDQILNELWGYFCFFNAWI